MIQIENLKKNFGKQKALDGLQLHVKKGDIFGFVGPNGAGKTTTMRIMTGLIRPDSGNVIIDGVDALKDGYRIKRKTGYMPDFFGVYDNLKAIEYMEFFASVYGITGSYATRLCLEMMDLVELSDKADFMVDTLSRGMKQRLCLARCLIHNPDILILDEPSSGLDPASRVEMIQIIRRLQAKGKTVFISSHILSEISRICTSIGIIDNGKMLVQGSMDDIVSYAKTFNPLNIQVVSGRDKAVGILKAHPDVNSISMEGNLLSVGFSGDAEADAALLKILMDTGVQISSFVRQTGNLEDLFIRITGRREVLKHED